MISGFNIAAIYRDIRDHPLIIPLYIPTIIIGVAWGMQEPLLPLYARDFGASYSIIGVFLSGQALGMLLTDIPGGMTLGRVGQKRAMIGGLLTMAFSVMALYWAGTVFEAVLYRLFTGIGFSVFGIARHAYLAEQVSLTSRGRAVALFGGINRIGRFVGPALGGLIASAFDLRVPFVLIGIAVLGTGGIVYWAVKSDGEDNNLPSISFKEYPKKMLGVVSRQGSILLAGGAGQLFAQAVRTAPRVLIPLYAADVLGLDVVSIGWLVSIGAAVDMTLFYPVGIIMDKLGRKFAIVPSFLLQGIGLLLLPLTGGFTGLAVISGFIGFGNGLGSGTMMTLGADLSPDDARGEFLGVWRLIGDAGNMTGPLVVGGVAAILALPAAAMVTAVSGFLASGVFYFLVPETVKK